MHRSKIPLVSLLGSLSIPAEPDHHTLIARTSATCSSTGIVGITLRQKSETAFCNKICHYTGRHDGVRHAILCALGLLLD
jgi:hypothetical protein